MANNRKYGVISIVISGNAEDNQSVIAPITQVNTNVVATTTLSTGSVQISAGSRSFDADQIVVRDASGNMSNGSGFLHRPAVSKIKTAIAAARAANPRNQAAWSAAPTWSANTTYGAGAIVRGSAASDVSNLYFMMGNATAMNAEGTSATSGNGPSGSAAGLITDGTCRWIFIGKTFAADTTTPFFSTATLAASTDEMNGYVQLVTDATASAIGLTNYQPVNSNSSGSYGTEAYFTGGLFGARRPERVNGSNMGTVAAPNYASAFERGSLKFNTNSTKWIALKGSGPSVGKNVSFDILVNGRFLSETSLVVGTDSSRCVLINLAKFPGPKREIEVRVNDQIQGRIAFEIYKEPDAWVWPAENPNRWRMAFEGDSITYGSYVCQYKPRFWIERIVGDWLGCDAVYNNAQGSTGAINDASGTKTTYIQRLQDVVDFKPDILFVGGFRNDIGSSGAAYTSAARQTAILEYLRACRTKMPDCSIVLIGTQLLQADATTSGVNNAYQIELDAKAAFDQFADSNSLFIPLLTDKIQRLKPAVGYHYVVTTAPYQDQHPCPMYYQYFGAMIAEKIAAWLGTK